MLVGGWGALRQTDLKALLAYSTISQLGMIVMTYGIGTPAAALAATLHILNHAAFKAPLFMMAGVIDHETGSRDLRRIGGLAPYLPRTTVVALAAAAAMAGVPLLNGFVSKELFYEACLGSPRGGAWSALLPYVAVAGSALTVAYCLRFVVGTFFGTAPTTTQAPHEPRAGMRVPSELLVLLCLGLGLLPDRIARALMNAAVGSVTGDAAHVHLALWHGWTAPVAMSTVAFVAGIAYFAARRASTRVLPRPRLGRTAGQFYDLAIDALLSGSRRITDALQTGSLRLYVRVVLIVAILLGVAGSLVATPQPTLTALTPPIGGAAAVTALTILATIAVAVLYRQRLPSVIALAAVGLFIAIYFAWLSAPDLVITQLLVETVTTILVVLVLYFLPKESPGGEARSRLAFDAAFAIMIGCSTAAVVYAVLRRPFDSISTYHLANSLPAAGGGNVVNVILVDFRGYDTLGEITVLGIAAVGVLALLQARRRSA
jgi:multicomponent K+:H+ antiporter subunit A